MWWITTTPPRGPGSRGRAAYASITSPPSPWMFTVSARTASYMGTSRSAGPLSSVMRVRPSGRRPARSAAAGVGGEHVAAEDAGHPPEGADDAHAVLADGELVDPLVVGRAAHLEHGEAPADLAVDLGVAQQDDAVGEGRYVALGDRRAADERRAGGGEQCAQLLGLDVGAEHDEELAEALVRAAALEGRQAVDGEPGRAERLDGPGDLHQVVLEGRHLRVGGDDLEQPLLLHGREVLAPAPGVAEDLLAALLEGEQQRPLAVFGGAGEELGDHQGLAAAGGARHQHDGVAEQPTVAQLVEGLVAGADPGVGRAGGQVEHRQRDDDEALPGQHGEGVLALAVHGAAHLQHLDGAPPLLVLEAV